MVEFIIQMLWFIFPAYCANAFPLLIKGKKPLDLGKKLGKYRILGDGKTVEGTLGGVVFGTAVGFFQSIFQSSIGLTFLTVQAAFMLSAGAIIGDIAGAFIKRRLGMPRGHPAMLLDQLDFLAGALLFSSFVAAISPDTVIGLVIITPMLHIVTNRVSYWVKLKKVPY